MKPREQSDRNESPPSSKLIKPSSPIKRQNNLFNEGAAAPDNAPGSDKSKLRKKRKNIANYQSNLESDIQKFQNDQQLSQISQMALGSNLPKAIQSEQKTMPLISQQLCLKIKDFQLIEGTQNEEVENRISSSDNKRNAINVNQFSKLQIPQQSHGYQMNENSILSQNAIYVNNSNTDRD